MVTLPREGSGGTGETWRSPAGETARSFAIVTTTPNALCDEIHNRMPVILKPSAWPLWLGEGPAEPPLQLNALLAPYPAEEMVCWPVSPRVGNVKNNDPICIRTTQRILSNLAAPAGKQASAGRRERVRELG